MLNIFLFPFHRFVIQFIQFWSPILFIYAPGSIHALMYFLLCCFTVIQCQLTLFNVGYLKDSEGQSVYTLQCYSPRPAGLPEKKGGKKKKPCEKKSSTMNTEEVHNANSFPNTTDCFNHNERKQALFAELHFNKQQAHKGLPTHVLFRHKTSSTV